MLTITLVISILAFAGVLSLATVAVVGWQALLEVIDEEERDLPRPPMHRAGSDHCAGYRDATFRVIEHTRSDEHRPSDVDDLSRLCIRYPWAFEMLFVSDMRPTTQPSKADLERLEAELAEIEKRAGLQSAAAAAKNSSIC